MNKIRLGALAALALASTLAFAAEPGARQDRMDQAYQNYRGTQSGSGSASDSGTRSSGARSSGFEATVRRDTRKTGHFFGRQGRRVGHAIANVGRKGEHAVGLGKDKTATGASTSKP